MADLSSHLAERGIDLGSLFGTMMAAGSPAKPEPRAGKKEDPAVLLGKLAESLGLSPTELLKHLGPAFKAMLSGQGASAGAKPRRKPKKDSAKPAVKPKPKPRPAAKPKKDSAKPATKPKPRPASKPKDRA
jgi:outer membrane biosynthesis protein TonB